MEKYAPQFCELKMEQLQVNNYETDIHTALSGFFHIW